MTSSAAPAPDPDDQAQSPSPPDPDPDPEKSSQSSGESSSVVGVVGGDGGCPKQLAVSSGSNKVHDWHRVSLVYIV